MPIRLLQLLFAFGAGGAMSLYGVGANSSPQILWELTWLLGKYIGVVSHYVLRGLEYRISLKDWLPPTERNASLPWYLNHSFEEGRVRLFESETQKARPGN